MRKQLFHFSQIHRCQFVTFRTKASIDDFLLKMKDANLDESTKQFQIDEHLDKSNLGRLLNDDIIPLIIHFCQQLEPDCYKLICLSVMPNHIHIMFEQKQEMSVIMQKIKGGLAFLINKQLDMSGSFWERDYFDKAIKDEKHFQVTYQYIKNNAVKVGLNDAETRFYGIYE